MMYPPKPIDPKKDLFAEIVRYTKEHIRYQSAVQSGDNDHGPWPRYIYEAKERKLLPMPKHITTKHPEDPSEHYYLDTQR